MGRTTKEEPAYRRNSSTTSENEYASAGKGKGKLKLLVVSKNLDKKRKKKEKKKKKKEMKKLEAGKSDEGRRRFENQSGKRTADAPLATQLTRNQLNKIQVLENREVKELLKEASVSYRERQDNFNRYAQDVTETNEMPPLVMTKIQ